jgi:hypothetical protein
MRKLLLGIVALLVAGELMAAAATSSRRAVRKIRVGDPALAHELVTGGASLVADYGAFQLLEVDPTRAAALIEAGRAEARDEEDLVLLNTRPLDTRGDEVQARPPRGRPSRPSRAGVSTSCSSRGRSSPSGTRPWPPPAPRS